jgi:hypothetical protein
MDVKGVKAIAQPGLQMGSHNASSWLVQRHTKRHDVHLQRAAQTVAVSDVLCDVQRAKMTFATIERKDMRILKSSQSPNDRQIITCSSRLIVN